jgi:hypothetical protein
MQKSVPMRPLIERFKIGLLVLALGGSPALAQAQQAPDPPAARPPKPYGGGTPLDTIVNQRFWTDVPEAKDFVRESRPDASTLKYQPTTGTDPERPKPRTPKELEALQSELEKATEHNERSAGRLLKKPPQKAAAAAKPASRAP